MATEWQKNAIPVTKKTWVRSYSQVFNTEFNTDFKLTAYLQQITVTDDGSCVVDVVGNNELEAIEVLASQAAEDPEIGPLAMTIQEAMTELIGILYARRIANG